MSRHNPSVKDPANLGDMLSLYAERSSRNERDETLLEHIRGTIPLTTDANEIRLIASRAWGDYFCVDVDLMIQMLRRWLEIEPSSKEAKRALGSYLLAHGPDWDDEGHRLLHEANT